MVRRVFTAIMIRKRQSVEEWGGGGAEEEREWMDGGGH